jgi:dephospho-CoA kinase
MNDTKPHHQNDQRRDRSRGLRLGLTGGMGCGKSTAAGMFRELGFGVLESDEIVRELWKNDEEVKKAAVARWGSRVLETVGNLPSSSPASSSLAASGSSLLIPSPSPEAHSTLHPSPSTLPPSSLILQPSSFLIDRRKVAEIVFADPKELEWVEGLLHPRVRARWQAALAAEAPRDWVVEIPLLFEKNLASEFDFTLCLWASPALQAARLAARGFSPVEIAARQARQWPLQEKIARADRVALNDGSLEFLRRQIIRLAGEFSRPAP